MQQHEDQKVALVKFMRPGPAELRHPATSRQRQSSLGVSCCTLQYIRTTTAAWGGAVATGKTSTLTFRIEPALKDALRGAAEKEHRSIANMVAVMIRDYCGRNDLLIKEPRQLPPETERKSQSRKR